MASETETDTPEATDGATGESAGGRLLDYRRRQRLLSVSLHVVAALFVAFLWIPLAIMVFLSFAENAITIFPFEGFTLENYVLAVESSSISFLRD